MDLERGERLTISYYEAYYEHTSDDDTLLDRAMALVAAARTTEGWHTVAPLKENTLSSCSMYPECILCRVEKLIYFSVGIGRNCFDYLLVPPTLDTAFENSNPLREWGSDILDTEIFRLEELEAFNSTEFELPSVTAEAVQSLVIKVEPDEGILTPSSSIEEVDAKEEPCEAFQNIVKYHPPDVDLGSLLNVIERVSKHSILTLLDYRTFGC